jgi:site-specific DNA-methyltransferase (adenine-specific)
MREPYFEADGVELYLGDCREVLPALGVKADLVLADPPYAETRLVWDRWPDGWLATVSAVSSSLWCFGSMRMFLQRGEEFAAAGWKLSQDVIWEKPAGTSMVADRFKRVHEFALHWYQGQWRDIHHEAQRVKRSGPNTGVRHGKANRGEHFGAIRGRTYEDNGTRLMRSIIPVTHMHGRAIHPTEKPIGILDPLIRYACPPGGLVVDPFAGSASTLAAARLSGRRAIGVEADERYAEKAALRLSQAPIDLFGEETSHA